ncbi:MAG: PD-(D/E)XK nuclease family protein [Lachnospiraceae bacterium]|nr:PD-(D/E)XK nuclease family protein [Lachnospiraceae bacterium]
MSLRFYIGGSGSGKSRRLYEDVIQWSQENRERNYLVIVPDQFTMQTQKDIVSMHPKQGIMNIDVLSFGRLSHRIFEEVGGNDTPVLDDTGKSLILRKVAADLEPELQVIGSNLKKLGFIHEVKSSLSEFMQYGIDGEELEKMIDCASQRSALQYKLKDLKVLFDGFKSYIKDQFITTEESLTRLKKVLHKSQIIKGSVMVFDGFTGFTPIQNQLIQELMSLAEDIIITCVIDGREDPYQPDGEQKLFHLTKKTVHDLTQLAEQAGVPRGEDVILSEYPVKRYEGNGMLAFLEHHLFRYESAQYRLSTEKITESETNNNSRAIPENYKEKNYKEKNSEEKNREEKNSKEKNSKEKNCEEKNSENKNSEDRNCIEESCKGRTCKEPATQTATKPAIQIYELSDPQAEVQFVCRQIHELIRTKGYKYQDMAVVTGDLPGYTHYIENEFEKFEIPVFVDQTNGIILNPFIEYIRSGINAVLQNFSYESMFHFLRSGFADLPELQIDRMENYCITMGIRGKKKWTGLWTRKTAEMGDAFSEQLEVLNGEREQIMDLFAPLLEIGGRKSTADHIVRQLYAFMVSGNLQQKLARLQSRFQQEGDLERAREYAQIYRLVCELLNQILELLGQEEMNLKEFFQILDAGFGEIQVGTIPQTVDQVVAGDIERTRLRQIKTLFFIGINDGNIPKSGGTGGIISDIDREFLNDAQFELAATPRQQMFTQRLYLYMNMTKPTDQLILSYVDVNGQGKSIRKAYLIPTIQRLFPELSIQKVPGTTSLEEIVTPREGLDYLVEHLRNYAFNIQKDRQELFTLFHWYQKQPDYQGLMKSLCAAAFYQYESNPISKAVANALYGKTLENSVSRLEKYAACAYAHFLQYGLQLAERKEFTFENVDMGNIFHGVLEHFATKLEASAYSWFDFPEEIGVQYVMEALDQYVQEYGDTILFSSARNEYMITRMRRILLRTVKTLQYQLKKGLFQPKQFELSFSMMEDLESVNIALSADEKMRLHGRIDRVDTYEDEEHVYVKVIDYKSGNKSFDLVALYYGLQLQLVVYLNAAMELTARNHKDKEVVPAAVLYYHVSDPMIERTGEKITPEELNQQLIQELRTRGVINGEYDVPGKLDTSRVTKSDVIPVEYRKDGSFTAASSVLGSEDLKTVSNYVNYKIKHLGSQILSGDIAVDPYERGVENSCTYCAYAGICGYDEKIKGFRHRKLEDVKKDEVLTRIKQELEQKGQKEAWTEENMGGDQ